MWSRSAGKDCLERTQEGKKREANKKGRKREPEYFFKGLQENMCKVQLKLNKSIVLIIPLTATDLSLFLQCDC
jgi:hypothetical protein